MAFYGEQFVDEIKEANNIVDVVSDYVSLKRTGTSYKGLCPFHKEKTPSFSVSADKQVFHCFGCGVGGDVIGFIRRVENVDFQEAIEILADRAKIELPQDDENIDIERVRLKERLFSINTEAAKYFNANLYDSKEALEYLEKRHLDKTTVTRFGIGFAKGNGNDLKKHLISLGFTDEDLVLSGLIIKNDNGAYVDRFRSRLMFPIFDIKDRVIAFGGRVLDNSLPKYMNSPETPIYSKSKNIFALNFARKSKVTRLLMVEGYMDVISLHKNGIPCAVASLGTALTESQARMLKKYANEIIIGYDSDGAGQAATERGLQILSNIGCNVKILRIPDAKDPDEYINKNGPERFNKLLDNAITLVEYKLDKLKTEVNIGTTEGKIDYLNKMAGVISKIDNSIEREVYIKKISSEIGIGVEAIYGEINKRIFGTNLKPSKLKFETKEKSTIEESGKDIPENVYNAEKMAIFLLCQNDAHIFELMKKNIDYKKFKVNLYKDLAEILYKYYNENSKRNIIDLFENQDQINLITGIMQDEYDFGNNIEKAVIDLSNTLKKNQLEEEKNEILKKLKDREDTYAVKELEDRLSEIITEIHLISSERRK
ncbi:MAG: DNA primase [Clostridia bacterium]|nr:DNA primase [Clostridia bacterium]